MGILYIALANLPPSLTKISICRLILLLQMQKKIRFAWTRLARKWEWRKRGPFRPNVSCCIISPGNKRYDS